MATLVLDLYSKAFPFITNDIRASVSLQTSPLAIVASIIDDTVGHPIRQYHFSGLQRENYQFSLDEIDGAGNPINNLALFSVVPSDIEGLLTRNDEQPQVGVTPGFVTGATTFTFDGAETAPGSGIFKPDYLGWDIVPSELTGRGILVEDLDYSWNKITGVFNLLQAGDIFPALQYYNIHFEPQNISAGNSPSSINDFTIRLVTGNANALSKDFGNKIIVRPTEYLELQLPNITTVPIGRKLMIEGDFIGGCSKIKPFGTNVINFANNDLYILADESISIYAFSRAGVLEWRVFEAYGNFKTVGNLVSSDDVTLNWQNKLLLDGASCDKFQFARLYNEFVLNLPVAQVCNFDDWVIGNNKYLYSLANSTDPSNADMFKIPDRRGLFERNNLNGKAGDYFADSVGPHFHTVILGGNGTGASGDPIYTKPAITDNKFQSLGRARTDALDALAAETQPKNYLTNKYVLI